jgi:hypothetical protein
VTGDPVDPRRAAFGDAPEADVRRAAARGLPRDRWLAAVTLGGQGRYAAAAAVLGGLVAGPDPVLASLACSTLAAHRRQLGGHAPARRWDAAALRHLAGVSSGEAVRAGPGGVDADGVDLAGAWSDALLGLAADAIGLGRLTEARRLHAAAVSRAERSGPAVSWRSRVRAGWVAAEIELAAGHPERAMSPSVTAAELAWAGSSIRHQVKSDIVVAAVRTAQTAQSAVESTGSVTDGGRPVGPDGCLDAATLLQRALETSLRRGIFSLAWPAAIIASNLHVALRDEFSRLASNALTWVFEQSDDESQRLARVSPWVPADLIRVPGVSSNGGG